jgi:hypothetical protein
LARSKDPGTVNREDLRRWQDARTLADLGELTAQWIEGKISSQPGYHGTTDIESPDMVPVLAAVNRAGYMTIQSQQGSDGPGCDGAHWVQRAAVEGFASHELAQRIFDSAPLNLHVIDLCDRHLPRVRISSRYAWTVTYRDREPYTSFGHHLSRRHLRDPHVGYGILAGPALDALCSAHQVTVIDLEPGRDNLLWDFLGLIARICEEEGGDAR